jgi:hypothetical protein
MTDASNPPVALQARPLRAVPSSLHGWRPLLLAIRSSIGWALVICLVVAAFAYGLVALALWGAVPDALDIQPLALLLGALLIQASFGLKMHFATQGITDPGSLGIPGEFDDFVRVTTSADVALFPTLLTLAWLVVLVLVVRRLTAPLESFHAAGVVMVSMAISATLAFATWGSSFLTNRYATFPPDSDFYGLSMSTSGLVDIVGLFFAALTVGFVAGFLPAWRHTKPGKAIYWYLLSLQGFGIGLFITVGLAVLAFLAYEAIDVEFVADVSTRAPQSSFQNSVLWGVILLLVLPTLVANLVWLLWGSSAGLNLEGSNVGAFDFLLSDLSGGLGGWLLGSRFTLWESVGPWMILGTSALVVLAFISGSVAMRRSGYRPKNFWALPTFLTIGVGLALVLRRLSYAEIAVSNSVESVSNPALVESEGALRLLDSPSIGAFNAGSGATDFEAILAVSALTIVGFYGAFIPPGFFPRTFPRVARFFANRFALGRRRRSPSE